MVDIAFLENYNIKVMYDTVQQKILSATFNQLNLHWTAGILPNIEMHYLTQVSAENDDAKITISGNNLKVYAKTNNSEIIPHFHGSVTIDSIVNEDVYTWLGLTYFNNVFTASLCETATQYLTIYQSSDGKYWQEVHSSRVLAQVNPKRLQYTVYKNNTAVCTHAVEFAGLVIAYFDDGIIIVNQL